jgi:hypothetical protein
MTMLVPLKKLLGVGETDSLMEKCKEIAKISPDNVQEIASMLQRMIVDYYKDARWQALSAFIAALILEIVAVVFFIYAVYMSVTHDPPTNGPATLSVIAGLLIQVMTGVVFYLYAQSARQFAGFHICLERTNRFLLANAMVEHLPEPERASKRAEVITAVLNAPMLTRAIIQGV